MSARAPDRLFALPRSQRIALDESGDPRGFPVFFFHGWPASRLQGAGFGPAAAALGLRLLTPDRPGIGLSTPQPGRQLLDWPPVVEELARQLQLESFLVLAVSGGGPYAMACAYALPGRVKAAAIVSGAPPLSKAPSRGELMRTYQLLMAMHRGQPSLLRLLFRAARPIATFHPPRWSWGLLRRFLPRADREALRDAQAFEGSLECAREAWRGSAEGVYEDAQIYAQAWGFDARSIRVPLRVWHGKEDHAFSWKLIARRLAEVPNCAFRFLESEGHFSLPVKHGRAILADLIAAAKA